SSVIATPARAGLGCPDGYARVGSCEASAHYYERLGTPIASRPARVFYSFVHDEDTCTPCGHEALSVIETCRHLCRRYFGQLQYNPTPGSNTTGAWDLGSGPSSLAEFRVKFNKQNPSVKALDACLANCGPPNFLRSETPWVSERSGSAASGEQD